MTYCINVNSREFQILQKKSGLPESSLELEVGVYYNKYGEFPRLEEIPGANSEPYLRDMIKLSKNNFAKVEDILNYAGTNSIQEAVQYINQNHGDLQVEILPINKEAIVKITHKPSKYDSIESIQELEINPKMDSVVAITNMVGKLFNLYGISIKTTNSEELESMGIDTIAKGLIVDGNILINTDLATIDTPIHEMLHLLIGGIRYKHPNLYQRLVEYSKQFTNLERLSQLYPNRTQLDLLEESLITEVSKYLTREANEIQKLQKSDQELLMKDLTDTLDYALMGTKSAEMIPDLSQHTLNSLAKVLDSRVFQNKFKGTIDSSKLTRKVANIKEELMRKNLLREECL